jgi:hypothetical protein
MSGDVVRIKHNGGIDGVVNRLQSGGAIKVGILAGTGEHSNNDDGLTVADIGAINEYGLGNVPERPFLRTTISKKNAEYQKMIARLLKLISSGKLTTARAAAVLGEQAALDIQAAITAWDDPPNSEATIDRKGANNPLIDTGEMRRSIWYEIDA